ncbi:hypothetical protein ACFL0C_00915 [Patescibacteria group bacterium]
MKKIPAILIVVLLIAIMIVTARKEPRLEDIDLDDTLSEINIPKIKNSSDEINIVDFSDCSPNSDFNITKELGSAQLKVVGSEEEKCLVETTFELEGGYYVNECGIPKTLGTIEFTSDDFDAISEYCKIKSTGSGLLELSKETP